MRSAATIILWVVVILVLAGCGLRTFFSTNHENVGIQNVDEGNVVAKSGMDFLLHLRQEGRLPGITINEHGNARISGRLPQYPFLLTMRFNAEGTAVTNNYRIAQIKKDSPWELERAWQTDTNGQIVQEWPVK